jgi:hypothetical protein
MDAPVVSVVPERSGIAIGHSQQPHMNNSLTSLAVFGLLGVAVIAFAGLCSSSGSG